MADDKFLYEYIGDKAYKMRLQFPEVPSYILDNIKYPLFDWQRAAIESFLTYEQIKEKEQSVDPTHLLFNMATGTGKTLVLASMMLYYYQKGYRHFIFFVNQNNIVGKTDDNLTNVDHGKYLFNHPIVINDKTVYINKVDTFSEEPDDIEIIFTSIHKLHNAVYTVRENSIFLDDLQSKDIVMLADEAHHLNSDTKAGKGEQGELNVVTELKSGASAKDVEKSWEHTVTKLILNKGGKKLTGPNRNVLLEFTATVSDNQNVLQKYRDKIIYRFDLKDFLRAGFTKEINLVSSSFSKSQRVLQAILFNWYRHHVALKHDIPHFKPVILFRSKFVDESLEGNISDDYKFFRSIVDELSPSNFDFLFGIKKESVEKIYEKGKSRIVDIVKYIDENNISYNSIIAYLQDAFADRNCIKTHSKDKNALNLGGGRGNTSDRTTADQDKILNSLEDKSNHVTAVFTCQRLTEGWDVLNLFDIVRMYEGRDTYKTKSGTTKAGTSTVSEVQLIGRGVRYYPFVYQDQLPNKRKFDSELDHELRVLEEFYFHSDKDERYIDELKKELKKQELLPDNKVLKLFDIKEDFKNSPFYQRVKLFSNNRVDNPNRKKSSLKDILDRWSFKATMATSQLKETRVLLDSYDDQVRHSTTTKDRRTITTMLKAVPRHIAYKALHIQSKQDRSILRFDRLREELSISSIDDLFDDKYLGLFEIQIVVPSHIQTIVTVPPIDLLEVMNQFFKQVISEIQQISNPHIGSDFEATNFHTYFDEPKSISVVEDSESVDLELELVDKDWYVLNAFHGTSVEKELITFLKETMENFKETYDEVYLLRNEQVYKIYDFDEGRGFMPDFLLFLKSSGKEKYYQVFIEPKGEQFADSSGTFVDGKEGWKEKFLDDITTKYGGSNVIKVQGKAYTLVGLPLYNKITLPSFRTSIKDNLNVEI